MNFDRIPPVENAQSHLDVAFRRGKGKAERVKQTLKSRKGPLSIPRQREIERSRIEATSQALTKRLRKIVMSFPVVDNLSPFYDELLTITVDREKFLESVKAVSNTLTKINKLEDQCRLNINKAQSSSNLHTLRKSFYGRVSALVEKLNTSLNFLNNTRRTLKTFPVIRDLPTIAIAGFPNVGKTTLLSKLSSSKPEIAEYAFTTKHINIGYAVVHEKKIQLLDTPGTLARDKMNAIEKQADLAIRHCAHGIVYVFDPTEPYPLIKQITLLEQLEKTKKPLLLYMSKADIAAKEQIDDLRKKYPKIILSFQQLQEQLLSLV